MRPGVRPLWSLTLVLLMCAAYSEDDAADQARLLLDQQRWPEALAAYEHLAITAPEQAAVWYDLARTRARTGDTAGAITALKSAIGRGWEDARLLEQEGDLATLRGHEDYPALISLIGEQ